MMKVVVKTVRVLLRKRKRADGGGGVLAGYREFI